MRVSHRVVFETGVSLARRESRPPDFHVANFVDRVTSALRSVNQRVLITPCGGQIKTKTAGGGIKPLGSIKKRTGQPMSSERSQNLQDTFLNFVRKNKVPLTIFLVNGVKLQGIVTWFDNFCLLLRRDGHSQLVYKHAISTIMPGHPIQMFEPTEDEAPAEKQR